MEPIDYDCVCCGLKVASRGCRAPGCVRACGVCATIPKSWQPAILLNFKILYETAISGLSTAFPDGGSESVRKFEFVGCPESGGKVESVVPATRPVREIFIFRRKEADFPQFPRFSWFSLSARVVSLGQRFSSFMRDIYISYVSLASDFSPPPPPPR